MDGRVLKGRRVEVHLLLERRIKVLEEKVGKGRKGEGVRDAEVTNKPTNTQVNITV